MNQPTKDDTIAILEEHMYKEIHALRTTLLQSQLMGGGGGGILIYITMGLMNIAECCSILNDEAVDNLVIAFKDSVKELRDQKMKKS